MGDGLPSAKPAEQPVQPLELLRQATARIGTAQRSAKAHAYLRGKVRRCDASCTHHWIVPADARRGYMRCVRVGDMGGCGLEKSFGMGQRSYCLCGQCAPRTIK